MAEPGDILISVRAPIGALNYAKDKCCIGRGLAAITIEDEAERNYVFHLLKARNNDLNQKGTGSTFKAMGKNVLEEVAVPQISPDEQQKCMDMMDLLVSIIRERKSQLDKLDELIKARFVELFGDPVRNSMEWETYQLDECLERIDNGKSFVCSDKPREGNYPAVLKLSAATYGDYRPSENRHCWMKNSLLKAQKFMRVICFLPEKILLNLLGWQHMFKKHHQNL